MDFAWRGVGGGVAYLRVLIACAFTLLSALASAATCSLPGDPYYGEGWLWRNNATGSTNYNSRDQALTGGMNAPYDSWVPSGSYSANGITGCETWDATRGICKQWRYRYKRSDTGSTTIVYYVYIVSGEPTSQDTAKCSDPPGTTCENAIPINEKHLVTTSGRADSWVPPDDICAPAADGVHKCKMIRIPNKYHRLGASGAREFILTYQSTAENCAAGATDTPIVPTNTEACQGSFCKSVNTGENCGWLNGEYTCLSRSDPDRCTRNASGSMVCNANAPMPPKPDNGTAGTPATPTNTVEACTGSNSCNQYNYYNSTTVSGSSRPVPTGTGSGGSGVVDEKGPVTTEEEQSGGSASGGGTCEAQPSCDGDPVGCAILVQQWKARCPGAPSSVDAHAAFGSTEGETAASMPTVATVEIGELDASGPISVGSCPAPLNVTIMGQHLSMDIWQRGCDMAAAFAPIVMAMAYFFAGLMLVGLKGAY